MPVKPDFELDMPARPSGEFQRTTSLPRTPRFHEDFDAPFSEAIANASSTALSDGSISPVSQDGRSSEEINKALRKLAGDDEPNAQSWNDHISSQEAQRRSTVNGRFKQWARKSFAIGRSRTDSSDQTQQESGERPPTSKSTASIAQVEDSSVAAQ